MEIHKSVTLATLFFVVLIPMLQHSCLGRNSPQDYVDNQNAGVGNSPQDYVDAHNAARAEVGVCNMTWDDDVASFAESYAQNRSSDCSLIHSGTQLYGENIAEGFGYGTPSTLTGVDAVKMWVDEKSDYDYNSNQCALGKECGHYTQVVWRNSTRLGCARVDCSNGGVFVTCNYDPRGNYEGELPY